MTNVTVTCRLDCSGVAVGVAVGVAQHVAPTEGGVQHKEVGGVQHLPRPCSAVSVRVVRPTPSRPNRASGEGKDGSDPPPFRRWRGSASGGVSHLVQHQVQHPPSPRVGVAPVRNHPCGKAKTPANGRAQTRQGATRCLTVLSASSSSSAACPACARSPGRDCSPSMIPWPCWSATTRPTCTGPSSPGTTSRPASPCSSSASSSSARTGPGSPDGAAGWGSTPPSRRGHFRRRQTARRSLSARSTTPSN